MGIIEWEEAEYPGMFTSAVASVQQGFQQFQLDRLTVVEFFNKHSSCCKECTEDHDCETMKKAKKEISKRLLGFRGFFNAIRGWERIMKWAYPKGVQ